MTDFYVCSVKFPGMKETDIILEINKGHRK